MWDISPQNEKLTPCVAMWILNQGTSWEVPKQINLNRGQLIGSCVRFPQTGYRPLLWGTAPLWSPPDFSQIVVAVCFSVPSEHCMCNPSFITLDLVSFSSRSSWRQILSLSLCPYYLPVRVWCAVTSQSFFTIKMHWWKQYPFCAVNFPNHKPMGLSFTCWFHCV